MMLIWFQFNRYSVVLMMFAVITQTQSAEYRRLCEFTTNEECNITITDAMKDITVFILSSDYAKIIKCNQCSIGLLHILRSLYFKPSTEMVDLSRSHISDLGHSSIRGKNLKYLILAENEIKQLVYNAFADIPQLITLDLCKNQIGHINFRAFYEISKLEVLRLCYNNITDLNRRTFSRLPSLRTLTLHHNAIRTLPEKLFFTNTQLIVLTLHHNFIESIDDQVLHQLEKIDTIDISNIQYQLSLNTKTVVYASNKSDCYIGGDYSDSNEYAEQRTLNFSCGNIIHIHSHQINGQAFQYLNLRNNRIKRIDLPDTFSGAPNLNTIDMAWNKIEDIHYAVFNGTRKLKVLLLNFNKISHLDSRIFLNVRKLEILQLQGNCIKQIETQLFRNSIRLRELNLQNNSIEFIGIDAFVKFEQIHLFDLSMNKIQNDVAINVNATYSNLTNSNASELIIGNRVSELYAANNRINIIVFGNTNNLSIVNLSNNYLSSIQLGSMRFLTKLDLSNNSIDTFVIGTARNLIALNLSHNQLSSFQNMTTMIKLMILDLSYNRIRDIDGNTFHRMNLLKYLNLRRSGLNHVNEQIFKELSNLEHLDISENNLKILNFDLVGYLWKHNLFDLYIEHNNLRKFGEQFSMAVLNRFPVLERLGIADNPWNCTELVDAVKYLNGRQVMVLTESNVKQTNPIGEYDCEHIVVLNALNKLRSDYFNLMGNDIF